MIIKKKINTNHCGFAGWGKQYISIVPSLKISRNGLNSLLLFSKNFGSNQNLSQIYVLITTTMKSSSLICAWSIFKEPSVLFQVLFYCFLCLCVSVCVWCFFYYLKTSWICWKGFNCLYTLMVSWFYPKLFKYLLPMAINMKISS